MAARADEMGRIALGDQWDQKEQVSLFRELSPEQKDTDTLPPRHGDSDHKGDLGVSRKVS